MSNAKLRVKLAKIQQELKVAKNQFNGFGKYNYRSAEDILEAVKPFEDKYKVLFTVDESLKSVESISTDVIYIESLACILDQESEAYIPSRGTAIIDFEAKGMQMPQRTGSASSYAKKYALGNLLLIDDTKDPDGANDHGKKQAAKAPAAPPAPKSKKMTKDEQASFLKGIEGGKFAQVEQYLSKYQNDATKKAVIDALTKAKEGK